MVIPSNRLIAYAAACSVEASTEELVRLTKNGQLLNFEMLPQNIIKIGDKGLFFSDQNLLHAVKSGFAFPQVFPLLLNLKSSVQSICTLYRIRKVLSSRDISVNKVCIGLRAGLSATLAFANYDARCIELLKDYKEEVIEFNIADTDFKWLLCKSPCVAWHLVTNCEKEPTAVFTFSTLKSAFDAVIGEFDHLVAPGLGYAKISGNIPLLDIIGYISRKAQKSVPSLV